MKRLVFLSFGLILAGSVLANTRSASQGKTTKSVLTGRVYDVNHAVIVSSEVVARSPEGKEYWATTNTEGVYKFELPLATYRIEANATGFCPKRVEVLRMRNSSSSPLDFVLAEKPPMVVVEVDGTGNVVREIESRGRRCPQQTMIKKEAASKTVLKVLQNKILARNNDRTSR